MQLPMNTQKAERLISKTALQFPWDASPAPGTWEAVAEGVYWLVMPLPFALNHINLWLIADGDGWALVDCGIDNAMTRDVWCQIFEQQPSFKLTRIVVTHHHPDHIGLAGWLQARTGAEVYLHLDEHQRCKRLYDDEMGELGAMQGELMSRHGLMAEDAQRIARQWNRYREMISCSDFKTVHYLQAGDEIQIGQYAWKALRMQGHTNGQLCFYQSQLNLLISADQVLPRISPNISYRVDEGIADPLQLFIDSLRRLKQHVPEDVLVLPSHGRPFYGLVPRIQALIQHHQSHLATLVKACEKPQQTAALLPVLFNREMDPHQLMFAMGEALAHLEHLRLAGALVATEQAEGQIFYQTR